MSHAHALAPRQRRFVDEYLVDLNGKQAAIRAGYSAKTAEFQASRLLRHVKVQAAVTAGQAKRAARTGVTADRVLAELARIAFSDLRHMFDDEGHLKPLKDLADDAAAAIASVEVLREKTTRRVDDDTSVLETESTVKVRAWDKTRALELLAKHLGMLTEVGDKQRPLYTETKVTFGGRFKPAA